MSVSLDKNEAQLEIGDEVLFVGISYIIENIVLDPKQPVYCTAELDMEHGIRTYCFNVEKVT